MVQTKITWIFFYVYFLSENLVVMMKAWWNLSTSAVKIIVVLYTQEIRGNLFLHCPKLPSPFLIKSTNIWMIMLARIFNILSNYRRRTLESFVYSTIRGGWYEGTEKINVNCRSPSRKKIKLPLNRDLTLWNSAVIYLFPIAVNLKSILFHLEGGN